MTWKTYAAVSGATVLAGWLASAPPSNTPAPAAAPRRAAPGASDTQVESDIEHQADRLQARMREETVYREPGRNPFRFGAREIVRDVPDAGDRREPDSAPVEDVVPAPLPPPVRLSGIAEDRAGDRLVRTAVLSSPQGVLLVREGDEVLGQYRVATIEADAVELTSLTGGTPLRLSLRR